MEKWFNDYVERLRELQHEAKVIAHRLIAEEKVHGTIKTETAYSAQYVAGKIAGAINCASVLSEAKAMNEEKLQRVAKPIERLTNLSVALRLINSNGGKRHGGGNAQNN